ncbi:MAG: dynamin family protein [Candidatus Baltobacteraceae bacterium]
MTLDTTAMRRYETARETVAAVLEGIEPILPPAQREILIAARERLQRARFVLAVVGEFSSGKSFLLNALLGKFRYETVANTQQIAGLLATDINPSTATITELEWGSAEEANAYYVDGRTERIPLDRLSKFVAVGRSGDEGKMHDATADENRAPARVLVSVDSPFLQRGFTVADTPGLASINPAHRRATLQFLPSADAVLYLIDTQQPFSEGDAAFLGIIRQHIDSIFIVQTKIDLWEQNQSDGREAWRSAYDRIASLAAIHAPGTYVYALSARQYAEGTLERSSELVARSRFQTFLDALDASLIATTGRARLRRAAQQAARAISGAIALLEQNAAMLALDPGELKKRQAHLVPQFDTLARTVEIERKSILARAAVRRTVTQEQAAILAEQAEIALTQAFDTADVARLRDRARLHILVDRTFADVVSAFADEIAAKTIADIETALAAAQAHTRLEFSLSDAAARAFGAEPGTGIWAAELSAAISATIVLAAIGGPAIALVSDIAARFGAAAPGAYMKRELTADLRARTFPRLRAELSDFSQTIEKKLETLYDCLAAELAHGLQVQREAELGSIERALAMHAANEEISRRRAQYEREVLTLQDSARAVDSAVENFLAREPEIAPADPGHEVVRRAHEAPFDQAAYGLGLRPQRWRVAVLGALRRGKSSLINAIAGTRVLADEAAGTIAYPVHVRYGPLERAYVLASGGQWHEVEIESALEEATRNPVLIEEPWSLPRELVLVHVPAFDSGGEHVEEIAVLAASQASQVVALFSRQLSDRELDVYERVAELGKPMLFVHTIADNETASERKQVVELAKTYLAERNILTNRIFTISTMDYAAAKRESRAPSAWNELDALISTLTADAEAHMERLTRLERLSKVQTPAAASAPKDRPAGLRRALARLLGKKDG